MNYRAYAKKIPNEVRSQRIITARDPITNAQPVSINYDMALLFEIWFKFIEPQGAKNLNCPTCLQNVLDGFRAMKADLVQLEKDYQLFKSLES